MGTLDGGAPPVRGRRALVVYVPPIDIYLCELWTLVRCVERFGGEATDVVCFGPEHLREWAGPRVRFVAHADRSEELYDGYRFAPSVDLFLSEQVDVLREYEHLVRTDTDVFLTPAFAGHRPQRFTVGRGHYVHDEETRTRILETAADLGLRHQGIYDVGSTWYGPTEQVVEVGRLTAEILPELLDRLRGRTDTWPTWFRGVALLYAAEIAVNHLVDGLVVDAQRLDAAASLADPIAGRVHLHCDHGNQLFSKAAFRRGEYDRMTPISLEPASLDGAGVGAFCLAVAVEGRAAWQSHLDRIEARSSDRPPPPIAAAPAVPLDDILSAIAARGLGSDLDPPPAAAIAAQWSSVVAGCRRHRLVGLLHQVWAEGELTLRTRHEKELRELHRAQRMVCRRIEQHVLVTVEHLGDAGIDVRVLKGVAAARLLSPDPALRPFHDADLLIRADDLGGAREVLERSGARRQFPEPRPGFDRSFGKGIGMVLPDGCEIDLHRTLAPGWYGLRIDLDELFEGGRSFDLHGHRLRALPDDRALVHACYHAVLGARVPTLTTQRDIVQLVGAGDDVGEHARTLARAWGGEAVLAIGLRDAWATLRPGATPAIVEWARAHDPDPRDLRRLAAYRGTSRDGVRQSIDAVGAIDGATARVRYLTALALPKQSGRRPADRWARAYRSLRAR